MVRREFWPGENGWLLLEYVGGAPDVRAWKGPVTGCTYEFGGDRKLACVDARDGIKLLTPRRSSGAMPVFRVRDEDTSR